MYNYKVLRWFGMKPVELERQLNVFGAENWAIVYANDAVVILGRQEEPKRSRSEVEREIPPILRVMA